MNYPLDLTFKIFALASQIYIRDASGNLIGYVKQKLFKLKEDINIFADENQTRLLYNIKAERIIDFSAKYNFTDANGNFIGAIKRQGMRSLWKANYEIFDASNQPVMRFNEENGWTKVLDSLVGELPVVGLFTGYVFNPAYVLSKNNSAPLVRLVKQPAFLEGKFQIIPNAPIPPPDETLVLLSSLMLTLMERRRG